MKAFVFPPTGVPFLLLAATAAANLASAGDWHQFQGPRRTGVSDEKIPLRDWPPAGPPVLWSVKVRPGFGGPAIRDGEVYILDRAFEEADILRCFDLRSGNERWRFRYSAPGRLPHARSRTVPAVDEERIYTVGPFGQVYCLSRQTHKALWQLSLTETYDTDPPRWGYSQSPILVTLHGRLQLLFLSVPEDHKGLLSSFDPETGEVIWKYRDYH